MSHEREQEIDKVIKRLAILLDKLIEFVETETARRKEGSQ